MEAIALSTPVAKILSTRKPDCTLTPSCREDRAEVAGVEFLHNANYVSRARDARVTSVDPPSVKIQKHLWAWFKRLEDHRPNHFAVIGCANTNRCPFRSMTSNSIIP